VAGAIADRFGYGALFTLAALLSLAAVLDTRRRLAARTAPG
jgi:hypothetical protein